MNLKAASCILISAVSCAAVERDPVVAYIDSHWEQSVRVDGHDRNVVPIPIPHTVPTPAGTFNVMFYWDTYFTNLGLLLSGKLDLAKSNCDALLWWIDRLGFVPNSAFVGDDTRSQPPLLCLMVRDVFDRTHDLEWLRQAYPRLMKEQTFWANKRTFPDGLAPPGGDADENYLLNFYDSAAHERLGYRLDAPRAEKIAVAANLLAEAELGEDFTPVFAGHALEYADVKLNSILWRCEKDLAYFAQQLGLKEAASWEEKAAKRAERVRTFLWDDAAGLFRPRNINTQGFAPVANIETFFPLWAGLATPEQARRVRENLARFERKYGVAATEPYTGPQFQWGYPVGWPPNQWVVARGLARYGFDKDARRIAEKYCSAQAELFRENGQLWEKYSVETGRPDAGEYKANPMLGWSAGVYLTMKTLLNGAAPF